MGMKKINKTNLQIQMRFMKISHEAILQEKRAYLAFAVVVEFSKENVNLERA